MRNLREAEQEEQQEYGSSVRKNKDMEESDVLASLGRN